MRSHNCLPGLRTRPLLALLAALAVVFAGCGSESGEEVIYWCSMHPDVRQVGPGTCPLCGGMRLVPLDKALLGEQEGQLKLTQARRQQSGLHVASVELRDLSRVLNLSGHFVLDPDEEISVHNPIPGSSLVTSVFASTAGQTVQEGQVLIAFENELLEQQMGQLQDALTRYAALRGKEGQERQAKEMLKRKEAILQQLQDAGVDRHWAMLQSSNGRRVEQTPHFPVRAPKTGVLLRTPIVEAGRYSRQGEAMFELADLSHLWLELETHARDLAWLKRGQRVCYTSPATPGEEFSTILDAVETVLDTGHPQTRVRARASNAGGRILPGTWARTTVQVPAKDVLAIPSSAVMRTGKRDVAIVAEGEGLFRPVALSLGRRDLVLMQGSSDAQAEGQRGLEQERFHEVLGGLRAGDRVVTTGSFLLLSEANFQSALERLSDPSPPSSKPFSPELQAAFEDILTSYETLRADLAADQRDGLMTAATTLQESASASLDLPVDSDTSAPLQRLESAAKHLVTLTQGEFDLEQARVHFGSISREVIDLLRKAGGGPVRSGELHLFRCPMADDYGFDLWLQPGATLANPYMGQRMLECGTSAEL